MFIDQLTNSGTIPTLELSVRYAAERQRLLAHNIANISTPDFRAVDVEPGEFQRMLGESLDRRRRGEGGGWRETEQIRRGAGGLLELRPREGSGNILAHDRNDRDVERLMANLAENTAAMRLASELLRSRFDSLRSAIALRA